MDNPEIIAALVGAVAGAALTCFFAVAFRSYEEVRSFREQIGLIRERFGEPKTQRMEAVADVYEKSVEEVIRAVCRVRPYVLDCQRIELTRLLNKFRATPLDPNSGFFGKPPVPPDYHDCFPDPEKAKLYLTRLLDEMSKVSF